jgi:hypothetical protein
MGEADAILKPWLRTWMTDHPPTEPHADFINIAHEDIRTATMNSKAWSDASSGGALVATAESLYWYPIEPDIYAGSRLPSPVIAAPKAAHVMPTYSR